MTIILLLLERDTKILPRRFSTSFINTTLIVYLAYWFNFPSVGSFFHTSSWFSVIVEPFEAIVNVLIIPCPNISLSLTGLTSVSFEVFSTIVFKKKVKFVHTKYDNTLGLFSGRFGVIWLGLSVGMWVQTRRKQSVFIFWEWPYPDRTCTILTQNLVFLLTATPPF